MLDKKINLLIFKGNFDLDGASKWLYAFVTNLDQERMKAEICLSGGISSEEKVKIRKKEMVCTFYEFNIPKHRIAPIRLLKIYFLIRKIKPDVILILNPQLGWLIRIYAKLLGIKIISRQFNLLNKHKKIVQLFEKLSVNLSDRVICVSNEVMNSYKKYVSSSKLLTINNAVQSSDIPCTQNEKNNLKKELGIKEDDTVYLNVGRLVFFKNQGNLIESFLKLINLYGNHNKLLIVGKGQLYKDLHNFIQKYDAEENIKLLGARSDVDKLFQISDFYVHVSLWEGLPNALLEAMSWSLPVIITDLPQYRDLLAQENAIVIKDGFDSKNIFKALTQSMHLDTGTLFKMGNKSKIIIEEHFNIKNMMYLYQNEIFKLIYYIQ